MTQFCINRCQELVVEAQKPDASFSVAKRAESDALQFLHWLSLRPHWFWRAFLMTCQIPRVLWHWFSVQVGRAPVPAPALDLANAKNNAKVGKKIGFGAGKGGRR